jgi:predicted HD superfamily hydrolase involved in NAD metabolism
MAQHPEPFAKTERMREMAIVALPTLDEAYERLEHELTPEALGHSVRTAAVARALAKEHSVDPDRAELAALIHDIAEDYSDSELLSRAQRFGIPISVTEARIPALLHGPVGAEILRETWNIFDEEILDAVRNHITGAPRMSPLGKILFVADKLESGRDRHYGGLDPLRELAMKSLDAVILRLYAWRMDELVSSGRPVDEHLVAARNDLIDRTVAARR